ncbi:unnamed protein product [Linum tenue]|uniref:Uncharacterized protein n=1 Tax=Linum tenue TaxID=586396 RepID=A0AAV0GR70_9ROSI|nr:unnamed protein product [Linum tenue]
MIAIPKKLSGMWIHRVILVQDILFYFLGFPPILAHGDGVTWLTNINSPLSFSSVCNIFAAMATESDPSAEETGAGTSDGGGDDASKKRKREEDVGAGGERGNSSATESDLSKEETGAGTSDGGGDDATKKRKREEDVGAGGERGNSSAVVSLGSMEFRTSREMFEFFDSLISSWRRNDMVVHKDNFPMLLDLVKKGHPEPEKLIGSGFRGFCILDNRYCSRNRTFYLFTKDNAFQFCFRSCVHNILPLPDDLKEQGSGAVCACHLPRPEVEEVILQPWGFSTPDAVFSHFFYLLYHLPLNKPITEQSRVALLELMRKGDPARWENEFGSGSEVDQYSFEARIHPLYMASSRLRSFFLVRQSDRSAEEFCFLKLVENICSLPEGSKDDYVYPCSCHRSQGDFITLGVRKFATSHEMALYFDNHLYNEPLNAPVTMEELSMAALDLVRKGDPELGKKIGLSSGVYESYSVQARSDPVWGSRAYFIVREDGSMEPFCFWTCINNILPLTGEDKDRCCRGTRICLNFAAGPGCDQEQEEDIGPVFK